MVQRIALVFGVVFLLLGVVGLFSAGGMEMGADPAPAMLLGVFPTNLLHNIVHILLGAWGLVAARSFSGAKTYATVGGIMYLVLAVCGVFFPTTFGLIPMGGHDRWLHALVGVVLAGLGFTAKEAASFPPRAA